MIVTYSYILNSPLNYTFSISHYQQWLTHEQYSNLFIFWSPPSKKKKISTQTIFTQVFVFFNFWKVATPLALSRRIVPSIFIIKYYLSNFQCVCFGRLPSRLYQRLVVYSFRCVTIYTTIRWRRLVSKLISKLS